MVKRAKFGIWINDKDKRLFRYLYEHKVALVNQINRDIYQYEKHQTLYNRLAKLEDLGFIQASYDKAHKKKKIFGITLKTFKEFVALGGERIIELKSENPAHDLDLVDIRYLLSRSSWLDKYATENIFQAHGSHPFCADDLSHLTWHNPDAALKLKLADGDVWCVLEYEASLRYKQRALDFFNKYHRASDIPLVLVVTKTSAIMHRLMRYNRRTCEKPCANRHCKFMYASLDDLRQDKLVFADVFGNRFRFPLKESFQVTDDCASVAMAG